MYSFIFIINGAQWVYVWSTIYCLICLKDEVFKPHGHSIRRSMLINRFPRNDKWLALVVATMSVWWLAWTCWIQNKLLNPWIPWISWLVVAYLTKQNVSNMWSPFLWISTDIRWVPAPGLIPPSENHSGKLAMPKKVMCIKKNCGIVIVWSVWFDFLWYVRSWFNYAKYVEKYMLDGDTDHTCTLNSMKSGGIQRKLLHVSFIK